MRIGIHGGTHIVMGSSLADLAAHAAEAEADGFGTYWVNQTSGTDALTVIATLGAATSSIEFGTAVVPTWGRHPHVLAGQALTVQNATGNRLALGIGVAHRPSVEDRYHLPFERPVRHLREYLDVLQPLLADRTVDVDGEIWSCTDTITAPPADPPPVLVAALGPQFLRLAGRRTDGTILWLVGPKTISEHIAPTIGDAAAEAGRPSPRIVGSVPVSVTDRPDEVRAFITQVLGGYNDLPSYRAMLDREGAGGPADVAVVGDEDAVRAGLAAFAEAGATDFAAAEIALDGEGFARTRALLKAVEAEA